jgi:hypothetical protein
MKNPFEIRTEVLAMAKDYMDKQYALNLELAQKMAGETAKAMENLPTMYTMEELMEKAKEMYKFVETK